MPKVEIIETRDGSSSLFLPELNETYHSTHGALTESQYVYVEMGLKYFMTSHPERKNIGILEIGFGTGLNPWLTAMANEQLNLKIQFVSLEKYPLDAETVKQLNYKKGYSPANQQLFDQIHEVPWGGLEIIHKGFSLQKIEDDLLDFVPAQCSFDLIYFDAFAPSKQPEMWSIEVLKKMFGSLAQGGVFVTYCAQGQFKRDLKSAGFLTEELPGPPGKKEMTRGIKP